MGTSNNGLTDPANNGLTLRGEPRERASQAAVEMDVTTILGLLRKAGGTMTHTELAAACEEYGLTLTRRHSALNAGRRTGRIRSNRSIVSTGKGTPAERTPVRKYPDGKREESLMTLLEVGSYPQAAKLTGVPEGTLRWWSRVAFGTSVLGPVPGMAHCEPTADEPDNLPPEPDEVDDSVPDEDTAPTVSVDALVGGEDPELTRTALEAVNAYLEKRGITIGATVTPLAARVLLRWGVYERSQLG